MFLRKNAAGDTPFDGLHSRSEPASIERRRRVFETLVGAAISAMAFTFLGLQALMVADAWAGYHRDTPLAPLVGVALPASAVIGVLVSIILLVFFSAVKSIVRHGSHLARVVFSGIAFIVGASCIGLLTSELIARGLLGWVLLFLLTAGQGATAAWLGYTRILKHW